MAADLRPRYFHTAGAALVAAAQGSVAIEDAAVLEHIQNKLTVVPYFWNPNTLALEIGRQPATGTSTGGSGSGSTLVDANLTSAGSTKLVGYFQLGGQSSAMAVDATLSSAGSTRLVGKVDINSISSSTAHLGDVSVSSGTVTIANPTTSVSLSSQHTVTADLSSVGSTKVIGTVGVSSGVVLGAGSSANTLGSVTLAAGSTANSLGSVALLAGSSGNVIGAVAISSVSWSSANVLGQVAQGAGSSANFWIMQSIPFSSAGIARTSVATSIDAAVIAANANRKALVIANGTTTQVIAIGLTTAVMTTALANLSLYLQPAAQVRFGLNGDFPLYTGPVRGINISSTALGGGVVVSEFT